MEIVTDSTGPDENRLRGELAIAQARIVALQQRASAAESMVETAHMLVAAYGRHGRLLNSQLEDERKESARLRERIAEMEGDPARQPLPPKQEARRLADLREDLRVWRSKRGVDLTQNPCPACNGVGRVPNTLHPDGPPFEPCGECRGTGKIPCHIDRACPDCGELSCKCGPPAPAGKHHCPACNGPNGHGTQTACIDCEPGIGNPLREGPS